MMSSLALMHTVEVKLMQKTETPFL